MMKGPARLFHRAGAVLIALCILHADLCSAPVDVIFPGVTTFKVENLREVLVEQLNEISISGLTAARADDAAWFLGSHYRKQGFPAVDVKYDIRGSQLVLKEIGRAHV